MMSINNPLKIVVDTNVLLVSILPKFVYYKIFEEIQSGKINLESTPKVKIVYK